MLEKLLESLDKEIFSEELVESLKIQFNEAVDSKAKEIADIAIEEKEKELTENAEKYIAEAVELKTKDVEANAEKFLAEQTEEMKKDLDIFLDKVVQEFISESEIKLNESLKSEKADMMIEAFESMVIAGSLELVRIAEAKDSTEAETKLAESITKFDALMVENLEMKKQIDELSKTGIISDMKVGLSLVEAKKFETMASMIPFSKDEKYTEQLEVIKESVKGTSGAPEKVEEVQVTESKIDDKADKSVKVDYSHLV